MGKGDFLAFRIFPFSSFSLKSTSFLEELEAPVRHGLFRKAGFTLPGRASARAAATNFSSVGPTSVLLLPGNQLRPDVAWGPLLTPSLYSLYLAQLRARNRQKSRSERSDFYSVLNELGIHEQSPSWLRISLPHPLRGAGNSCFASLRAGLGGPKE